MSDPELTPAFLTRNGFRLAPLCKRLTFRRGRVDVCPPCGPMGWWVGVGLGASPTGAFERYLHPADGVRTEGDLRQLCEQLGNPLPTSEARHD